MNKQEQIKEVLTRGVENVYPNQEVLEKVLNSEKKLKIYYGIDPTGPALHLGHSIQLLKLKQLQDMGHQIIILIGDFTAQIGDPTDKASARKQLSKKVVYQNSKNYRKTIGKILNLKKTKFKYNSKWLGKMGIYDFLTLSSYFTAQQILARDMFKKRIAENKDLFMHEFLYPYMQAYDSVALDVDMEIGGNDQMFNMLAGRTLMKKLKNKEKFVLTTKLLVDPAGKKMGKTEGNMVSLVDTPEEMFGKVMSWTDEMIIPAFEIATAVPLSQVDEIRKALGQNLNPKEYKAQLASTMVEMYHGAKAARKAEENFKQVFEEKLNPNDIQTFKIKQRNIVEVLVVTGLAASNSEARRLLAQGGIKVDNKKVIDENFVIGDVDDNGVVIQKGKRHFAKIIN